MKGREKGVVRTFIESLVEGATDDAAYRGALGLLLGWLKAEGGIFLYLDEYRLPRIMTSAEAGSRAADRATHRSIEDAAEQRSGSLRLLGFSWPCFTGRCLVASKGEEAGAILIGREAPAFSPEEESLLDSLMDAVTPVIAARTSIAREMRIRSEVEKSLRHSEESLRTFFAESRDMIYTSNADDCIASINAAGLALLGCKDRFEAVGRRFSDFALNRGDRENFFGKIRERGFVDDYEIVIRRPDGGEAFCVENARAVRDATGKVVEVQGIVRDISERVRSERELWKTNQELVEANLAIKQTQSLVIQQEKLASIGYLAAGVAHEINNPLGFLLSNHEFFARFFGSMRSAWEEASRLHPGELAAIAEKEDLGYFFSETEALLAESEAGYRRIMEIVKSLKDYARTGKELRVSPYDLNKGLDSALVVAWNKIKYVAEVEKDYGELPLIEADGGSINQVLLNVLVNAAEAIEGERRADKGHIILRTRLEDDHVVCGVEDNGPGVPEELRLRIFDPFFTTKEPGKGTGLGLSISYDIVVNRHGGSLSMGPSPSGGSLFTIRLPLRHPTLKPGDGHEPGGQGGMDEGGEDGELREDGGET